MYNLHFLFEYAGDRILQPISRKLHPGAMCTIYTFCSNMRVSAFYSPFFVNCTQVQIFQTGVKKLKITVEYDFSSFCTNYAPPSFGMVAHTGRALDTPDYTRQGYRYSCSTARYRYDILTYPTIHAQLYSQFRPSSILNIHDTRQYTNNLIAIFDT